MKTLVDIDEVLLKKAMKLSKASTKKETIHWALDELVKANQRKSLKGLAGSGILEMTRTQLQRLRRGTNG